MRNELGDYARSLANSSLGVSGIGISTGRHGQHKVTNRAGHAVAIPPNALKGDVARAVLRLRQNGLASDPK